MSFYVVNQGVIQTADAFRLHCMADFISFIADHFDEEPVAEMVGAITQAFESVAQSQPFQEHIACECPATVFHIHEGGFPIQVDGRRAILNDEATPFEATDLVEAS